MDYYGRNALKVLECLSSCKCCKRLSAFRFCAKVEAGNIHFYQRSALYCNDTLYISNIYSSFINISVHLFVLSYMVNIDRNTLFTLPRLTS